MNEMELHEERTSLTMRMATPLSADAVEQLIRDLAEVRQDMQPQAPLTFAQAALSDCVVTDLGQPPIRFIPEKDGIRPLFCHAGLGWLTMVIDGRDKASFLELLGQELPKASRTQ